ncbi:MAG TPA: response regulator [Sandaracinaceae bacterium]
MAHVDGRLVVAVDDDPSMRRVLARVLAWRGFRALVADGRASAYALILEHRPAVVTVDCDLGADTGVDLVNDVRRALGEAAPAMILVSAAADRLPRGELARFDAVHVKPFRASALLDDVERLAARAACKQSGVRAVDAKIGRRRAEGE